jgi:O-acetylserine/cysteine efflux transporter
MSMRFSLSAVLLCWFFPPPVGQLRSVFIVALVSATIQYGLTFTGLAGLDASAAVLLVQLEVPFGALLAAIFLNDKLGWKRTLGMALAFFGVSLIAGAPNIRKQLFSAFLVMSGALTWSLGQVMIKKMVTVTGFQLIAWVAVFAGPQMFISSLILEKGHLSSLKNATIVGWGTVIYMGIVMTALGYAIWYHLLNKYDVNQVMPFLLLLPVSSICGAVLFLGERPDFRTLIGGVFVIIGVAAIVFLGQSQKLDSG